MTTIKKPRVVRQAGSEAPPGLVQMACSCGQIFTQSLQLTTHMFKKHIYSPQFEKMKSITQQLSIMKHLHKSTPAHESATSAQTSGDYGGLAVGSVEDGWMGYEVQEKRGRKKQAKKPRNLKNLQAVTDHLNQSLGIFPQTTGKEKLIQPKKQQLDTKRQSESKQHQNKKIGSTKGMALEPHPRDMRSDSEQDSKQNPQIGRPQLQQKQPRRQQVRQFYNSRVFMCGECISFFVYSAELNVHVSLYHNGQYPDGSIFGLKKHEILSFFKLPCERPIFPQAQERGKKYKCGCGTQYAASSSLVNHIKLRHSSVAPLGTLGLPHTKRIKQYVFDGDVITFAT